MDGRSSRMVLIRPDEPPRRLPRLLVVFVVCVAGAGAWWWTGHPIVAPSDVTSLALVAQSKVTQLVAPSSATQPVAQSNAQQQPSSAELSLLDAPPARMREALHAAYRLAPDQRCLLAFGEIDAWVSGAPAPPRVESRFESGLWSVRVDQREVARLPELADFDDCSRLLVARARAIGNAPPRAQAAAGATAPRAQAATSAAAPHVVAVDDILAELDAAGAAADRSPTDPAVLVPATRDLVLLSLQTVDLMEISDRLQARAWAFLAMSQAFSDADLHAEAALLADHLGYSESAGRLVARLDAADPVRAYVVRDEPGLRRAAKQLPNDGLARMLLLLRLGERGDYPGWVEVVRQQYGREPFAVPVLTSGLELNAFVANRYFANLMPYLVLLRLSREAGDGAWLAQLQLLDVFLGVPDAQAAIWAALGARLNVTAAALVRSFEQALDAAQAKRHGRILDAELYREHFDALFYSALYRAALFALDQLSSIPAAEKLVESFAGSSSPRAVAFVTWLGHLVEAKRGNAALPVLLADVDAPLPFGAAPRQRTFTAVADVTFPGKPQRYQATRRLVRRLDSRPAHASWFASEAYHGLLDLNLAEELSAYVVRTGAAGFPEMRVWHAGFVGDAKGLERAFHDPTVPADAKKGVIERLVFLYGENDPRIDSLYRALLRDSPQSYDLVLEFSEHLEKRGEYAKSREVLMTWLGLRAPDSGLERIIVQSRIARTYYLEGDYQAAWKVVAPLIESQQAGAMERAALTLAKLGRKRESEDLFTRVVARYPDSLRVRLSYAGFLWSESRNADAAQLLRGALGTTSAQDWNKEIATSFADSFAKRSDRDVLDAFAALKTAGVPHGNLRYLVRPFHRSGRDEVAFRMGAGLRDPTLVQAEIYTEAYQSLREWKGAEAAAQWLREQIPPPLRNPASMVFFQRGETDILWNVVEQPEQGANPEWVWLVRAMSTLQTRSLNPARRRALGAYFAEPRDDGVQALARYLIDSGSEDDVWRRARDRRTRAEAAYVVGLKRLCEGDARAASDWFRIVQEIAEERMGEYHWSADQLWHWRQEGRSLDRLRAGCGAPGANA